MALPDNLTHHAMSFIEAAIQPRPVGFVQTKERGPHWRWLLDDPIEHLFSYFFKHRCEFFCVESLAAEDFESGFCAMCTYTERVRCKCGAEGILRTRALI